MVDCELPDDFVYPHIHSFVERLVPLMGKNVDENVSSSSGFPGRSQDAIVGYRISGLPISQLIMCLMLTTKHMSMMKAR